MMGEFALNAGSVLNILVGQKGRDFQQVNCCWSGQGGGGGGTFVADENNTPLIVAGGGAGTGGGAVTAALGNLDASITTSGFNGGAYNGHAGGSGGANGWGGSFKYGQYCGYPGAGFYGDGTPAAKAFVNGGDGYDSGGFGGGGGAGTWGGGGGGGYSGGGNGIGLAAGGGGGSYNSESNRDNTAGVGYDGGSVTINYLY